MTMKRDARVEHLQKGFKSKIYALNSNLIFN